MRVHARVDYVVDHDPGGGVHRGSPDGQGRLELAALDPEILQYVRTGALIPLGPRGGTTVHLHGAYVQPFGETRHGDDPGAAAQCPVLASRFGSRVDPPLVVGEARGFGAAAPVLLHRARLPVRGEGLPVGDHTVRDREHLDIAPGGHEAENALVRLLALRPVDLDEVRGLRPAPEIGLPSQPGFGFLGKRRSGHDRQGQGTETGSNTVAEALPVHDCSFRVPHRDFPLSRSCNLVSHPYHRKEIPAVAWNPARSRSGNPTKSSLNGALAKPYRASPTRSTCRLTLISIPPRKWTVGALSREK